MKLLKKGLAESVAREYNAMVNLLTIQDIQDRLKIKKSKAYQLVNTPGFPAIRIDSMIRVPEDKFEKWLYSYIGKQFKSGN